MDMSKPTLLLPYLGRWDQFSKSRFHQIADRLAEMGVEIHVIQTPPLESEEITFKTREIDLPDNLYLHEAHLSPCLWNTQYMNKVLRKGYYGVGVRNQVNDLIIKHDVDALWLYNLPHLPLVNIDIPIVFDIADDYIAMLNNEISFLGGPTTKFLEKIAFKQLLLRVDLITVISHELEEQAESLVGTKVPTIVVPNGVDTTVFNINDSPKKEPHSPPTVGFVGAFEYFIDFDLILDTAELLPEVRFLLVGDGRKFSYVATEKERRQIDNIDLTGLVESHKVPDYIDKMDIGLNTFKRVPVAHSALPLKLFEYIARAKPVISTDIHEVHNIDEGFINYANTPENLADKIEIILNQYEEEVSRTNAARQLISEKYNWDTVAEDFKSTLLEYNII